MLGHFGNAPHVLLTVIRAESQAGVEPTSDVVAIQYIAVDTFLIELGFNLMGQG